MNQKKTNGLGIAAMILGIIAFLLSCCGAGGLLGIVGLILGIVGLTQKDKGKGMATTGVVLSSIAILISLFTISNGGLPEYIQKSREASQNSSQQIEGTDSANTPASTEEATPDTEEIIEEVDAGDICVAYDENEVNCKNLYEGKTLRVTGVIEDIGIDVLDKHYLILYSGSFDKTYVTLHCTMSDDVDISSLSKDTTITLVGTYSNSVLSPELKDCTIE